MRYIVAFLALVFCDPVNAGYFGVGTGTATADFDTSGSADRVDDEDNYLKIFGGPSRDSNYGVEFGYISFGKYSAHFPQRDRTDQIRAKAITVAAVLNGELTQSLGGFLRLGLDYWSADYRSDAFVGIPASGSSQKSGSSPYIGAGIDFRLSEKTAIRLEYEKYKDIAKDFSVNLQFLTSAETAGSDIDLVGLSLVIDFGSSSEASSNREKKVIWRPESSTDQLNP
ncbi:MAG TPA: outer membrane beta-barrel protein [Gammaproteobacteria bacterium]|nr:outer membrane beta-barrel protein [Gammaproteobacteria bacterium]